MFGQWVLFINYYKLWYKIDQVHAYTLICANNKIINSSIKYVIANYYKFDLENSVNKSLFFKNFSGEGATPYRTYPHSELCASLKPTVSYKCLHITTVLATPLIVAQRVRGHLFLLQIQPCKCVNMYFKSMYTILPTNNFYE